MASVLCGSHWNRLQLEKALTDRVPAAREIFKFIIAGFFFGRIFRPAWWTDYNNIAQRFFLLPTPLRLLCWVFAALSLCQFMAVQSAAKENIRTERNDQRQAADTDRRLRLMSGLWNGVVNYGNPSFGCIYQWSEIGVWEIIEGEVKERERFHGRSPSAFHRDQEENLRINLSD